MTYALTLNNITCERDDRVLFSQLTATFSSGDMVQVVGPNGAGKTSLLKILTGLSHHYSGDLVWRDPSLGDCKIPSYDFYTSLLFLGHAIGVNSSLTPLENVSWYFGLHGPKEGKKTSVSSAEIIEALDKVGLAGYEDIPCYQMSAGQLRRVALARLYLSKAPLWVLDEPFTAIDKQGVHELEQCFNAHRERGGIVILTTHQSMHESNPVILDLADYIEAAQ